MSPKPAAPAEQFWVRTKGPSFEYLVPRHLSWEGSTILSNSNAQTLIYLCCFYSWKEALKDNNKTKVLDLYSNFQKSSLPYEVFNNHLSGTKEHPTCREESEVLQDVAPGLRLVSGHNQVSRCIICVSVTRHGKGKLVEFKAETKCRGSSNQPRWLLHTQVRPLVENLFRSRVLQYKFHTLHQEVIPVFTSLLSGSVLGCLCFCMFVLICFSMDFIYLNASWGSAVKVYFLREWYFK